MNVALRFGVASILGMVLLSGCGSSKAGNQQQMQSQHLGEQHTIRNPELKHLLDNRKQQRQLEHDIQSQIRQHEIQQKTYSTPPPIEQKDKTSGQSRESSKDGAGKPSSKTEKGASS